MKRNKTEGSTVWIPNQQMLEDMRKMCRPYEPMWCMLQRKLRIKGR